MTLSRSLTWTALVLSSIVLGACGGGSSSGASNTSASNNTAASESDSNGAEATAAQTTVDSSGEIFLSAFTDFACSPGWQNRNGGLGRAAYSGDGTCETPFPGESGVYAVYLQAQTEADGSSPYAISINGETVSEGAMPYAYGSLQCSCSTNACPDRIVNLGAGIHEINNGDSVRFYGDDVYPCGEHGSYAKWQGLIFQRQ